MMGVSVSVGECEDAYEEEIARVEFKDKILIMNEPVHGHICVASLVTNTNVTHNHTITQSTANRFNWLKDTYSCILSDNTFLMVSVAQCKCRKYILEFCGYIRLFFDLILFLPHIMANLWIHLSTFI